MLAAVVPTAAFEPALSAAEIHRAEERGVALAHARLGFPVANYTVYASRNALTIERGQGAVDAIIVATPYQRVLYAAYLAAYQGAAPSAADVRNAASPYTIDVIVAAHSAGQDADEQSFLSRFSTPTLTVEGAGAIKPLSKTIFGPTVDFYNFANTKRVLRWIGDSTYRFDLRGLTNVERIKGSFAITDPQGHRYTTEIDLAKLK